jgi:cytoskeletal protein CcmA (bactofilin family)
MFDKAKVKDVTTGQTNRIVDGTIITGDITCDGGFRLDGTLIGNFTSVAKLVIGPSGEVQGEIKCKNLDIEGSFTGKLDVAELLSIKSKSTIKGTIVVGKLSVEPGALFEATCAVKPISKIENQPTNGIKEKTTK